MQEERKTNSNSETGECEGFREPHSIPRGLLRFLVMRLLESEEMSGTDIMNTLHEKSGGQWQPSPGSIYPMLSSLEEEGIIRPERTEGRSKIYVLSTTGKERLAYMMKNHAKLKHKARLGPKLWIQLMNPHERMDFHISAIEFNLQALENDLDELTAAEKKQVAKSLEENKDTIDELLERLN